MAQVSIIFTPEAQKRADLKEGQKGPNFDDVDDFFTSDGFAHVIVNTKIDGNKKSILYMYSLSDISRIKLIEDAEE